MPKNPRVSALTAMPPALPETQALFGPRPLIAGEDAAAYDDLFARVTRAVAPADILEQMWVRDVVDLAWDVLRLRRLKARLIASETPAALAKLLAPHLYPDPESGVIITPGLGASRAKEAAEKWVAREQPAVNLVNGMLASGELSVDDVMAECLSFRLDTVERIDQLTAAAEARRNAALREIERHRASAANAARRAIDDVEDAEFEDVPPQDLKQQDLEQHDVRQHEGRERSAA